MPYNPDKHHRRSVRLKGYDYTQPGPYFVTICTQDRECLFGEIADGTMELNAAGRTVAKWWIELGHKFIWIETDEHVVMPNHFHGIVVISRNYNIRQPPTGQPYKVAHTSDSNAVGATQRGRPMDDTDDVGATRRGRPDPRGVPHLGDHDNTVREKTTLGDIIDWFKTMTTNEYIRGIKQHGWQPFAGKLWQRNYYEHIVRNDDDLGRIREYICNNPARWQEDENNPNRLGAKQ